MEIKKKDIWHESKEVLNSFSKLSETLDRLVILESIWEKVVGDNAKYWVIDAVQGGTIYVKVKVMAARHELKLKEKEIIRELNKHFERSWIKQISII